MFATASTHKQPFIGASQGLRALSLSVAFTRGQAQVVDRQEADLEDMPLHVLDELGLLTGEGCVSDWGLFERATRLRDGWA